MSRHFAILIVLAILAAVVLIVALLRRSWGQIKIGMGSFLFDENKQARSSVMLWLAFSIDGLLFIAITLYHVLVKEIVTDQLTNWFFWGASILVGTSGGVHGYKAWLQAKSGVTINGGPQAPPAALDTSTGGVK